MHGRALRLCAILQTEWFFPCFFRDAGAMLQLSGTPGEAFALLAKLGPHSHRRGYAHDGDRVRMRSNRRQSRNFHALLLALPPSA